MVIILGLFRNLADYGDSSDVQGVEDCLIRCEALMCLEGDWGALSLVR